MYRNILITLIFLYHLANVSSDESEYHEVESSTSAQQSSVNVIVGGEQVVSGRYSYQVAYLKTNVFVCGGSLISTRWVLTAAHCGTTGTHVQLGRHDLSDDSERYEEFRVVERIQHPNYNPDTYNFDFMLLKLSGPSDHAPVALDAGGENTSPGADLTVTGWGTTSAYGITSAVLLETEVDVVNIDDCRDDYGGILPVTQNMLCAARPGKDSCQGDSGGPLIIKGNSAEEDVQVGIVSWGVGCADPKYPGVYARVKKVYGWITQIVQDDETEESDPCHNGDDDFFNDLDDIDDCKGGDDADGENEDDTSSEITFDNIFGDVGDSLGESDIIIASSIGFVLTQIALSIFVALLVLMIACFV